MPIEKTFHMPEKKSEFWDNIEVAAYGRNNLGSYRPHMPPALSCLPRAPDEKGRKEHEHNYFVLLCRIINAHSFQNTPPRAETPAPTRTTNAQSAQEAENNTYDEYVRYSDVEIETYYVGEDGH